MRAEAMIIGARHRTPEPRRMGRARKDPDLSTYAGRVAARIRQLRDAKGWSMEDLQAALAAVGAGEIPTKTLYCYERGKASPGGADLPINLLPFFAAAFGYATAGGFLPPID